MKYKKYRTYYKRDGESKWTQGIKVMAKKVRDAFELAEEQYGEESKAEILEDKDEKKTTNTE